MMENKMPSEKEIEVATIAIMNQLKKSPDRVQPALLGLYMTPFAEVALGAAEKVRWQPIETAPKDGTEILGAIEYSTTKAGHLLGGNVEIIKSVNTEWYGQIWCKRNGDTFFPTHWIPLPEIE